MLSLYPDSWQPDDVDPISLQPNLSICETSNFFEQKFNKNSDKPKDEHFFKNEFLKSF